MNSNIKKKKNQRPLSSKVKTNKIFNDQKNISSHVKKDNLPYFRNDYNQPIQQTSNFPSIDKNNRSKSVLNESYDDKGDSLNEEYSIIQKIWNNLGVTYRYQFLFDNYIKTCSGTKIKNIFLNEKNNLRRFGESLLKLSKEIISRENNIHSLRRYIFALINGMNYFEEEENENIKKNREKVIMNIISLIKSLRLNSVNAVTHFLKVREVVTYYTLIGKIDIKLISKEYKYDENYLIKMNNDMNFLNDYPQLSQYFDMNNSEIDAFLTNFAPNNSNNTSYSKINSNKVKIPVSDELKKAIAQCRYFLIQESFFNNMKLNPVNNEEIQNYINHQNMNNDISKISNNNISIFNNSKKTKNYSPSTSNINFFKEEDKIKKEMNYKYNNFFNMEDKEIKKNILNDRYDNNGNSRNLEYLRKNMGKEYNNLFMKNNEKFFIRNKRHMLNINPFNNNLNMNSSEVLFRKPLANNQIIIEREERIEKPKVEFRFNSEFIIRNENPLSEENEKLNRQLTEMCEENEKLSNKIQELKKYIIDLKKKLEEEIKNNEIKQIKKMKEIQKKELESELKYKELDKKNDNLTKEKNNLSLKIKETKTLMEKNIEENKQKINDMNKEMQRQKRENEQIIENKNKEIKELNDEKTNLLNEKNEIITQKEQIINERDQLIDTKNNLEEKINGLEEKIRSDDIEIENYKKLQIDYKKLQIEYKNLINKENEMNNEIGKLNEEIQNLKQEKQNMANNANSQMNDIIQEKNQLQQNVYNLNETIKKEQNEKEQLINDNNNLKEEINNLNNKINKLNNTITDLETKITELNEEIKRLNEISPDDTSIVVGSYKYDFYKGNLFNFINTISEALSLEKIPDFIKNSFNLEKINIFDESTYIKGVYPKIITSSIKKSNVITGICSLYYENYGENGEPLILRIEALCVLEKDWEEQIENIINYIKEKMVFDEIKYVIRYTPSPEHENKLRLNQKIKDLFKTKLNCIWKNLTNYSDGSRTQDIRFIKEGNYFDREEENYKNNNKKLFGFNSLSIISLCGDEGNLDEGNKKINFGFNKYINLLPVFILLGNNPVYRMIFLNEEDANFYQLPEDDETDGHNIIKTINPKNQIKKISDINYNISDISLLKEKINSSQLLKDFDINDSLFEEIYTKLQGKNIENISFNYFSMNLNLSTTTNYCLEYENYYYNRISSKDIDILLDTETKNNFYLIPTKTESTFILISQVGRKLQKQLLDGHKNIYETFMEYHPKLTSQLLKFSSLGITTTELKDIEKTLYIPSFKIDTHLYSYSMKEINKKGNIIDERSGEDGMVGSIEEYFKMSFEEDKDIKNSFSIIPVEDNKLNMVIREPFLFGVFNINIASSIPLQLFYVTKDHWIKTEKNDEN